MGLWEPRQRVLCVTPDETPVPRTGQPRSAGAMESRKPRRDGPSRPRSAPRTRTRGRNNRTRIRTPKHARPGSRHSPPARPRSTRASRLLEARGSRRARTRPSRCNDRAPARTRALARGATAPGQGRRVDLASGVLRFSSGCSWCLAYPHTTRRHWSGPPHATTDGLSGLTRTRVDLKSEPPSNPIPTWNPPPRT